jgi:transcription elongation factor GreA
MGLTYLTKEGYKKLKEELEYLQTVKKPEISRRVGVARDHGDLKENFEYHSAKEALTQTMMRIRDIGLKLSSAQIIDDEDIPADKALLGTTVKILDLDEDEEEKYMLVCTEEADPMEDKISIDSPIGKGLFGHKEGDVVEIQVPAGTVKYKILEITRG